MLRVCLDVHTALHGKQDADTARSRVHHEAQVHLVRKIHLPLDAEAGDPVTLDRCVGVLANEIGRFGRGRGKADAPGLPSSTDTYLRFDYPRPVIKRLAIDCFAIDKYTWRDRYAQGMNQFFGVVLE